jgi:hypothetical protein
MINHHIVGEVEDVLFPGITTKVLTARMDTGAQNSAIWATAKEAKDGSLSVVFFDESSQYFSGETVVFEEFKHVRIRSSNGIAENRYKVKLLVEIDDRRIRAWFTLAIRNRQTYPVLIGRNILRNKFVVDVAKQLKQIDD